MDLQPGPALSSKITMGIGDYRFRDKVSSIGRWSLLDENFAAAEHFRVDGICTGPKKC
jgi:hypothetical protein